MPKVRTLRPHAHGTGLGVWRRGQLYDETSLKADQKVRAGLVEYAEEVEGEKVLSKESPELYRRMTVAPKAPAEAIRDEELSLVEKRGSWFFFSDGEKVLGKTAAAEKLGVTTAELEAVSVDSDDD